MKAEEKIRGMQNMAAACGVGLAFFALWAGLGVLIATGVFSLCVVGGRELITRYYHPKDDKPKISESLKN